jgi:hypothetical protein
MSKLRIKDRVILKNNETQKGIIVGLDRRTSRFQVLWDKDWRTGRTHYHDKHELKNVR